MNKFGKNRNLPKWLNLHNAVACSYWAYTFLSTIEKVMESGQVPLPADISLDDSGEGVTNGD